MNKLENKNRQNRVPLSPLFNKQKTLSEYFRRGFSYFSALKTCTKNAPSVHLSLDNKERETILSPFKLSLLHPSKVCVHHLLPGLISKGNVWFHSVIVFMSSV